MFRSVYLYMKRSFVPSPWPRKTVHPPYENNESPRNFLCLLINGAQTMKCATMWLMVVYFESLSLQLILEGNNKASPGLPEQSLTQLHCLACIIDCKTP